MHKRPLEDDSTDEIIMKRKKLQDEINEIEIIISMKKEKLQKDIDESKKEFASKLGEVQMHHTLVEMLKESAAAIDASIKASQKELDSYL